MYEPLIEVQDTPEENVLEKFSQTRRKFQLLRKENSLPIVEVIPSLSNSLKALNECVWLSMSLYDNLSVDLCVCVGLSLSVCVWLGVCFCVYVSVSS